MSQFSFLSDITIAEPKQAATRGSSKIPKLEAGIRFYKKGAVELSDVVVRTTNATDAMDVFFSHDWVQYPKTEKNFLIIHFGDSKKADIKKVGNSTFVKEELWPKLVEEFGLGEAKYADFNLESVDSISLEVALLPKKVQRGVSKGDITFIQRKDAILIPLSIVGSETQDDSVPDTNVEDKDSPADLPVDPSDSPVDPSNTSVESSNPPADSPVDPNWVKPGEEDIRKDM